MAVGLDPRRGSWVGPADVPDDAHPHMVEMRDGVRLATDVYLPARGRRQPVILIRLPYDKCGEYAVVPLVARIFREHGYAVVAQDVRGKFRSEGVLDLSREVADGFDTLDWIVRQRWSNGAVGMFGESYYGFTQWAAAVGGHPALRAIAPRMIRIVRGEPGSVPDLDTVVWWSAFAGAARGLLDLEPDAFDWSHRPLADIVHASLGIGRPAALDLAIREGFLASADRLYGGRHPRDWVRIPVLHLAGWFDIFVGPQIDDWLGMRARCDSRSSPQCLWVDSVDHYSMPLVEDGEPPVGWQETLTEGYTRPVIEFYDRHLRLRPGPELAAARWHVTNGDWHESDGGPPARGPPHRHPQPPTTRGPAGAEGGALTSDDDGPGEIRWTHDPDALVPSQIVNRYNPMASPLPDERAIEARPDVLTFTGAASERPVDLVGPVSLRACLATSAPSMHLMVKLVDVYPSGRARRIADRAVHVDAPDPTIPRQLAVGHLAYRLRPGHRLRLELASSAFPAYLPHPGTAASPWRAVEARASEQRLLTGAGRAYLDLFRLP